MDRRSRKSSPASTVKTYIDLTCDDDDLSANLHSSQNLNVISGSSTQTGTLSRKRRGSRIGLLNLEDVDLWSGRNSSRNQRVRLNPSNPVNSPLDSNQNPGIQFEPLNLHMNNASIRGQNTPTMITMPPSYLMHLPAPHLRRTFSHHRRRDTSLDFDNIRYKELLALQERIGNVNAGLDEQKVMKCLNRRKYEENSSEEDPCCAICQETCIVDEDVATLTCGHDFHTACIKKWLILKNMCPVCKKTHVLAS